jgi:hypothetical protein
VRLTHTTLKAVFLSGHFLLVNHILTSRRILGNNRRQRQQSRLEFGLGLSYRHAWANDLDVDAHRGGKRFVVRADEKLTAFVQLGSAIRALSYWP